MGIRESLAARIGELEQERVKLQESLEIIRDRIEKADAKYRSEGDMRSYHKWSSILSGLEEELDRTRALLVSCEAELTERKRKLAEHEERREKAGMGAGPSEEEPDPQAEGSSEEPGEAPPLGRREESVAAGKGAGSDAQAALDARAEGAASDEEQVPEVETGAAESRELDETTEPPVSGEAAEEEEEAGAAQVEEPEGDAVAELIERVSRGEVSGLTFGDFEAMLDRYVEILHRLDPPEEEQQFEETLLQSLRRVEREMGRLRRKWLPYAPVDPE